MKNKNWFWGIVLLAAAVFLIVGQTVTFAAVGFWSIVATIFLAALLVSSVTGRSTFGVLLSLSLLYCIYQKPFGWPQISVWILLLASILASAGFHIIFHPQHKRWYCEKYLPVDKPSQSVDGNNAVAETSFNDSCRYLHADALQTASLSSSFGDLTVYFDQVKLSPEGAAVNVNVRFGDLVLYIPKQWRVVNNTHASFGSVEDHFIGMAASDAPMLTITGEVSFGELALYPV